MIVQPGALSQGCADTSGSIRMRGCGVAALRGEVEAAVTCAVCMRSSASDLRSSACQGAVKGEQCGQVWAREAIRAVLLLVILLI